MLALHLYVVGNFRFPLLLDVVHQGVLQNLDAQNLDALPPFLDVVHLVVVLVGVELRHRLRKDYFQDEVGVELLHLLRMDYFQDAALVVLPPVALELELQQLLLLHLPQPSLLPVQPFQHRVMPSERQDRHRVLLRVLLRVQDLLLELPSRQPSSSLLPS